MSTRYNGGPTALQYLIWGQKGMPPVVRTEPTTLYFGEHNPNLSLYHSVLENSHLHNIHSVFTVNSLRIHNAFTLHS